tara:strand:- start:379 stop:2184 length:1806 start_codon:yes stop_codon:yes gene_type:complete
MITNINEILVEWAYRTRDGLPNPKSMSHQIILEGILQEYGWSIEARSELIGNLMEKKSVLTEDWWADMTPDQQAEYIKDHPKSEKAAQSKDKDGAGEEDGSGKGKKKDEPKDDKTDEKDKDDKEETSEDNPQSKREETISKVLDLFIPDEEQSSGAGRFKMSEKDVNDYKAWLKLTPEERKAKQEEIVERQKEKIGEVSETDIDDFEAKLLEKLGKEKFKALIASIRKKGDPPAKYLKGKYPKGHPKEGQGIGRDRERQVIRHYLETGGVNPMNGEPVAFSEAQLDHITSLDNGGVDGGENWMWMAARINQFKGSLTDTEVESKLIERDLKTANELDKETSEAELKNWQTQAEIAYWETRFEGNNIANLSVESIDSMNADEVTNLVKAWNRYVGEGDPRYIARYGTRKAEVDGKEYPITRDGAMQPDKDNPNTWGIQKQPDGTLKKTDMTYEDALAAYDDARGSGGAKIGNEEVKENITIALTGVQSPFKDDEGNSITIPTKSEEDAIDEELEAIQGEKAERKQYIKDLQKDIRANPQSADNLKKQIEKEPEYKKFKADMKAVGKKAKNPNPEEYDRLKKKYDEWRLNKWRGWQSLLQKNN